MVEQTATLALDPSFVEIGLGTELVGLEPGHTVVGAVGLHFVPGYTAEID